MAFPTSTDSFSNPSGTTLLATDDHANQHRIEGSAVVALEQKVGLSAGTPVINKILVGSGNGTSIWGTEWDNATLGTPQINTGTINNAVVGTPAITGGTANAITLGTPVVDFFTSSSTALPSKALHALAPTVGTIADAASGTLTPNVAIYQVAEITLGTTAGNRTLAAPLNPTDGQSFSWRIKNNAAATGTLIWNAIYRWSGGTAGTAVLGTTASAWNYFGFRYNQTDTKWDSQGTIVNIV
jgi:hypothetical protein